MAGSINETLRSARGTLKIAVVLFTACCIVMLFWCAFTSSTLSPEKFRASKDLFVSLYVLTPLFTTVTILIVWLDCRRSEKKLLLGPLGKTPEGERSESFKSVSTINSGLSNSPAKKSGRSEALSRQLSPPNGPTGSMSAPDSFRNLTPESDRPITLANLKKSMKLRAAELA